MTDLNQSPLLRCCIALLNKFTAKNLMHWELYQLLVLTSVHYHPASDNLTLNIQSQLQWLAAPIQNYTSSKKPWDNLHFTKNFSIVDALVFFSPPLSKQTFPKPQSILYLKPLQQGQLLILCAVINTYVTRF